MGYKNSSEVREIFCLSRQNMRSLTKLVKPKGSGKGTAFEFSKDDMNRLLDIKMYQLAGCELSEIQRIFNDGYGSDETINEQIRLYEKRIIMLKFIRDIRSDVRNFTKLSPAQITEINKKSSQMSKLPEYGTSDFDDALWDFIELVLIFDLLSQKKSLNNKSKENSEKVLNALRIILKMLKITGKGIKQEDITSAFIEFANFSEEDDQDFKTAISEALTEYEEKKGTILDILKEKYVESVTGQSDPLTQEVYMNLIQHLLQFISEYFVGEEELNNLYTNFRNFIYDLDQEKLKAGVIKLKKA